MNQSEQIKKNKKKSMYSHILHRLCSKRFFVPLLVVFLLLFASCNRPHNPKIYRDYSRYSYVDSVPVNDSTIESLAVLGKVWGFVKYYHPVFEDSVFNVDYELFELLPKIIPADYTTRNKVLCDWIDSLGTFETDEGYYKKILADTTVRKIVSYDWMNDSDKISPELSGRLNRLVYAKREGKNRYSAIPMKGAIERPDQRFRNEDASYSRSSPDCGYRLLALFRYWNMVEYYYPSKPLIQKCWEDVLHEYIPLFIKSYLQLEYRYACYRLFAEIEDTHASSFLPDDLFGKKILPIRFQRVEGKWIITHVYLSNSSMLQRGDIIDSIAGIPIDTLVKNMRRYISYSNEAAFYREAAKYLQMTSKDSVIVAGKRENENIMNMVHSLHLTNDEKYDMQYSYPYEHPAYEKINDSTGYICVEKYKEEMEKPIQMMLKSISNLIIDIRSNNGGRSFHRFTAQFINTEHIHFICWYSSTELLPGTFIILPNTEPYGKKIDKYNKKIILLVNERTQSSYEFLSLRLKTSFDTKIIGNITAGAGGAVVFINLPGGIYTMFTSQEFLTPSGTPIQRLGVPLDEVVPTTIQGIKEGRDEVYERALELIKKL